MKHKVSELEGTLLDAAVAKCYRLPFFLGRQGAGFGFVQGDAFDAWELALERASVMPDSWPVDDDPEFPDEEGAVFEPHADWSVGGPIIERERIVLVPSEGQSGVVWSASVGARDHYIDDSLPFDFRTIGTDDACATGPTPLIAAMRAFVTSKFGDEVEFH